VSRRDRPAVIVVGGGCTGLLVAVGLSRADVDVVVVEQQGLGGGQTAHAHGWLHHGHIYDDVTSRQARVLRAGSHRWRSMAERHGIPLISSTNVVAFSDADQALRARRRWEHAGIDDRVVATDSFPGMRSYATGEVAVSPGQILRSVASGSTVRVVHGQVTRVIRSSTEQPGVEIEMGGASRHALHADHVVVAAGVGTADLPHLSVELERRASHMLVVQTSVPLPAAFAFPEQRALGLFAVRRSRAGKDAYLLSDFLSSSPVAESGLLEAELWRRAIEPVLRRYLPAVWADPDARWGTYPVEKLESTRDVPLGVPGALIERGFDDRVITVSPGKLTSAPVVADDVITALSDVRRGGRATVRGALPVESARWAHEDWGLTPLMRRDTLFRRPA
jgi:glycine/D-amino acid oxidase-like deaminating enzyme